MTSLFITNVLSSEQYCVFIFKAVQRGIIIW